MRTDLWVGWKITLLLKKHFGMKKKKSTDHHTIFSTREGKRKGNTVNAGWVGAEAPLRSGGLGQGPPGRRGGSGARHLHLNTTGFPHHRSPCPFHSYHLTWCSFWCGDTFTLKKKWQKIKRIVFSFNTGVFCMWPSQQRMDFTDGRVHTEPKTFKVGKHTSFKNLSNTLHVSFPLQKTEKINNKSISQRS